MTTLKKKTQLKIYKQYEKYGVSEYYSKFSAEYYNPHAVKIAIIYEQYLSSYINNVLINGENIIDIACGNGLIKRIITTSTNLSNIKDRIKGCDPYFNNDYVDYSYSFEDIAQGIYNKIKQSFKVGICCYAFHLLNTSWHYSFFNELAEIISRSFIIITPSKKVFISHPKWIITNQIRDKKQKITIIILENIMNTIINPETATINNKSAN